MPSNDSNNNPAPVAKKGKKKSHKKKSKKSKPEIQQSQEEDDDNDYESLSDSSDKEQQDDEEELIPGVSVVASSTQGQSESTKLAAAMIYHYESTQLEDQIHVMIRKIAEECKLDKDVVGETVNRMFESGLQYDNHDEVVKMLKPKTSGPSVPADKAVAPIASSVSPAMALDADAAAALARFNTIGSTTHHNNHAHHTRSEHHGTDAKHGREIEALSIDIAPAVETARPTHVAPAAPLAAGASAPQQALHSMKEKLDYVATYSQTSLYDSLAALCSWASVSLPAGASSNDPSARSEKEQKMEAFFHSQALEILLTTLFSDDQQQLSRAEVKGAFQALLQHVLLLQADPQGTSSVHQITEALAQLVSQVYALRGAQIVPSFASSSSRGNHIIAQQIAACVKKLYLQLSFNSSVGAKTATNDNLEAGNGAFLSQLEAIDAQLQGLERSAKKNASATDAAQEKVQNMFLSREIHADKVQLCFEGLKKLANQQAPKLSSAAVQRPTPAAPSASATDLSRSVAESSSLIEHILLSEFDHASLANGALSPVSASSLQTKHQQSHHINSTFEVVIHERDAKMALLNHELNAHNARLQELNTHKQRLLEQVRLCDAELNNVGGRVKALTTDLSNATYFYQQQLDQLVQTGNTVRKSLQAHDQVNSLITAVRTFETKFAEALLYQHAAAHASAPHSSAHPGSGSNGVARNTTVITSSAAGMQVKNSAGVTTSTTNAAHAAEEAKAEMAERVLLLTNAVQSYVAAEAQCIQFLTQRVATAQTKQAVARKELLAYAALMMKGQVVTNAEATVSQLDAEISEDVQAVRQLQQNVADTLTQIRTVNGSGRVVNGKVVTSTFKYPAVELAVIVHACQSIGVTPAAEIVLLADKTPMSVQTPVVAPPAVAPAPAVVPSASVQSAAAVSQAAPRAPRVDKPAPGKDARAASTGTKTDRDGRRDRDGNNKQGAKRQSEKSEVDTVSAIQQLERSCLQKPSTGSAAPVKVAAAPLSTRSAPAPRAANGLAVPLQSVWKVPASASVNGVAESKSESGESVKTLKEIQAEQQNEKQRQLQLRQQKAAASVAAAVAPVSVKKPEAELTTAVAVAVAPTELASAVVEEPTIAAASTEVSAEAAAVKEEKTEEAKAVVEKTPSKSPKKKSKGSVAAAELSATTTATTSVETAEVTPVKSAKKKGKGAAHAEETAPVAASVDVVTPVVEDVESATAPSEVSVAVETVSEPEPVVVVDANESKEEDVEVMPVPLEEEVEEMEPVLEDVEDAVPAPVELMEAETVVEEVTEHVIDVMESPAEEPAVEHAHTPSKTSATFDYVHSTPVPSSASAAEVSGQNEDQENQEVSSSAALTPSNTELRPHADSFTSPLVEFHHAYKIKEIGIPVVDNDEGDVNPMLRGQLSPVVNYTNTYPELEEECELLIEMEVDEDLAQSTDDERDTAGPDSASEAGDLSFTFNNNMIHSASNSVTSNRSQSKMRDINPMARPSPGKGSRVRLDIAQGMGENDAAVAIALEDAPVEEKINSPETDGESSGPVENSEQDKKDKKAEELFNEPEVEKIEVSTENNTPQKDSVPSGAPVAAPDTSARTVRSLRFAVYSGPTAAATGSAGDNE